MQFGVGDLAGDVGFSRDRDQGELVGAIGQMAIDRVVAEVGFAADEPAPERRLVVFEDLLRRLVPMDRLRGFGPEHLWLFNRLAVDVFVAHGPSQNPWLLAAA